MPKYHPFSQLSPASFLQTFVTEMMKVCDEDVPGDLEQLIEQLGLNAGQNFESAYRYEFDLAETLDYEQYAAIITGLKNKIGGNFSLDSSGEGYVRVVNTRCPFGDRVKETPELCHMTSSVFGGIAARNFGYAKVELRKRIATHDGMCDVYIYTDREKASRHAGTDYCRDDVPCIAPLHDHSRKRIEERMHLTWCATSGVDKPRYSKSNSIVAHSMAMRKVLNAVETIAPTLATVLVTGETGVGKDIVARAIHAMSDRWNKKFVAINCGAIPETLIETTLFGHEKGAFTGAVQVHHGVFHRADGGTLFLDEVDALLPATQTKLLRVLQEGEYERVGGSQTLTADVRIIAATNRPMETAVKKGEFRQDLYYRLNVVHLDIPPLRERLEDIPPLVVQILAKLRHKYHKPLHSVSNKVMRRLMDYSWPGNIRELENVLERGFLFTKGSRLDKVNLPMEKPSSRDHSDPVSSRWKAVRKQALDELEKRYLEATLRRYRGDIKEVAKWMELSPRAVYLKLRTHCLDPQHYRTNSSI